MSNLRDLCIQYFDITAKAEESDPNIDDAYFLMVDAAEREDSELATAVRAYDHAMLAVAERGLRVISDDVQLNDLANRVLVLAGSTPRFTHESTSSRSQP